ncbi:hypothetical protein AKO1_007982, partial [Acrasis kona]
MPIEPKPEFYATFEEYETAMLKWSVIMMGLPFLPPHSSQFQFLMGLKIQNYPSHKISGLVERIKEPDCQVEEADDDLKQESQLMRRVSVKGRGRRYLNLWSSIRMSNQIKVRDAISGVLEKRVLRRRRLLSLNPNQQGAPFAHELKCVVHGQLDDGIHVMTRLDLTNLTLNHVGARQREEEGIKNWIQTQRGKRSLTKVNASSTGPFLDAITEGCKHQIALRRLPTADGETFDNPPVVRDGKIISYKIPEFDLGTLTYRMFTHANYIKYLHILLIRMDNGHRYDPMNSWYHAGGNSPIGQHDFKDMDGIMAKVQHPSQINSEHIRGIFLNQNVFLDTFYIWLNKPLKESIPVMIEGHEHILSKNISLLMTSVGDGSKDNNFKTLLSLFNNCKDKLVHAKVSIFIMEYIKTEKAIKCFNDIIINCDLHSLYCLATAVTFCDEVPTDLYEYRIDVQHLIKQMFDESVHKLICDMMLFYYLDSICVSLLEEEKTFNIYPTLINKIKMLIDSIERHLKFNNTIFLSEHLWKLLGHRSRSLSQLGRFLLQMLFFMSEASTPILELLRDDDMDLVSNLRLLATCKLQHVQHAVARIFPSLQERQWRVLLTETYSQSDMVINDLIKSAMGHALNSQPPLISSLVLDFFDDAFSTDRQDEDKEGGTQVWSVNMIDMLIEGKTFHKALKEILDTSQQKRMHQGTIMGGAFLAKFAKYMICKRIVKALEKRSTHIATGLTSIQSSIATSPISVPTTPGSPEQKSGPSQTKSAFNFFNLYKKKDQTTPPTPSSPTATNRVGSSSTIFRQPSHSSFDDEDELNGYRRERCEIVAQDMMQMMDFICQEVSTHRDRTYKPRMYVLEAYRHLIKCPSIYALVSNDESFWGRVLELCADGADIEFNRNAWRLFYQCIKHHIENVQKLIENNMMQKFMDLIGAHKSYAVRTNSLHYFAKILSLSTPPPTNDQESEQPNKKTKTGYNIPFIGIKDYDKHVKSLNEYMERSRTFLPMLHETYVELTADFKGWPFQSLASFYHTLNSNPTLLSKYKSKRDDFRGGLALVEKMMKG